MDYTALYADLTSKLEKEIPIKAFPIRELVQIFRNKNNPITLKSELTITSVINSGDISGILCGIELEDGGLISSSLMHLNFNPGFKLYKEIEEYKKKRAKRIAKLNAMR